MIYRDLSKYFRVERFVFFDIMIAIKSETTERMDVYVIHKVFDDDVFGTYDVVFDFGFFIKIIIKHAII